MKKVLSFVLVLALVLSSFSMAFAANTTSAGLSDVNGNANQDAIQVCYDLGVVTGNPDGTFLPAKEVTRAEFAAMLTRALDIPDSALSGYTTTSFKDTAGYTWAVPYLAFCQSKGILLGDGAGNVFPGKTITVNEAMTMALRAIGYTANSSLLVGAWPSNYVSIAQNNDMYDDVAKTTSVNKASAAQIIYNLLTVQKVAVNSDGTTDYLWDGKEKDGIEANLLNTNLGCEAYEDEILGASGYGYDDALINITGDLGAYGDAYLNSDDELVAFTKHDSVALTGKLSDDQKKFEVGDVDYDISDSDNDFTTEGAYFINGDYYKDSNSTSLTGIPTHTGKITIRDIASFAAINADDNETVTLNADLSGKTIKDIYSVVGWKADDKDLAESDVQSDIDDQSLIDSDFDTDDDDAIDMKSFELVGVASLDKIAKDDVVYVYDSADDDVIRKVAVGTETVEGTVDEIDYNDAETLADTITISGKDYDVSAIATDDAKKVDVDDDGTFYLDYNGEVYDYDGSSSTDTYGIIKATSPAIVDNVKLKLYTSEDSTKTFTLNDDLKDIDWNSKSVPTEGALYEGNMIGYSLDSNGDIDEIDNTAVTYNTSAAIASVVKISSSKVLVISGKSYTIDSDCVVMTYDSKGITSPDDVAKPSDLETGWVATGSAVTVIFNDDKDVVALYVSNDYADASDDAIYGVINKKTSAKDDDGDKVNKYTGFIDGTAFTYKDSDSMDTNSDTPKTHFFGVYGFELDSSDVITKIIDLTADKYDKDESSGFIVKDAPISDVNSDKTIITIGKDDKYTIDDKAVVYKYDKDDKEFTVSKLSALRKDYIVSLFDTKDDDADGVASVVIYMED